MKNSLQLLLPFLIGITVLSGCQANTRQASRYLIPDGYVGWVRIDYKAENASVLPTENGFYLVTLPPDGHLRTSSPIEYGSATDEYFYYSGPNRRLLKATGWGEGRMIWGQFNGSLQGSDEPPYQYFFVGSEEQFKGLGLTRKKDDSKPSVGPISALSKTDTDHLR